MANFVRRLKKHSRVLILTQSFGALLSGFLAWSGLLVLLDLYDAYSPIQETEVSSWMLGVALVSGTLFRWNISSHMVKSAQSQRVSK